MVTFFEPLRVFAPIALLLLDGIGKFFYDIISSPFSITSNTLLLLLGGLITFSIGPARGPDRPGLAASALKGRRPPAGHEPRSIWMCAPPPPLVLRRCHSSSRTMPTVVCPLWFQSPTTGTSLATP
jgi:hypothetical protein